MPLTITPERFAAIRAKIMGRKAQAIVAEITATDWNDQPHFHAVDDFLKFADTFIEQCEVDPSGSRKRR
jgi:hypothetical protein